MSNTNSPVFRHKTPIQIRFNDLDAYGHVNNSVYAHYYDLGKESYFADTLKAIFFQQSVVVIIAHIEFDFIEPIHYGDNIVIETRIAKVGNKSLKFEQRAVNTDNGHVISMGKSVMVCVDSKTHQSVEVPPTYREVFERYEAGETI